MRLLRSSFKLSCLSLVLFVFSGGFALAQDPSPDQCTCDLVGFGAKTGADVVNATSCVQELRHPWCDIYLAATEESEVHSQYISIFDNAASSSDFSDVQRLILELMERYLQAIPQRREELADQYGTDFSYIESQLGNGQTIDVMQTCIGSFVNNEPIVKEGDGYSCAVGSQSGWLNLQFRRDNRFYRFLFAPS
ncbi:hypothetical protein [uncultured Roseobacter sp.]|uniref:hypothetical protein n=1 Tax=uncultured Roseobacter sp. TaxID=114847 RepID=UPI00261E8D44|nr:hypothetical protein [uncultured Roseobacter sp.]